MLSCYWKARARAAMAWMEFGQSSCNFTFYSQSCHISHQDETHVVLDSPPHRTLLPREKPGCILNCAQSQWSLIKAPTLPSFVSIKLCGTLISRLISWLMCRSIIGLCHRPFLELTLQQQGFFVPRFPVQVLHTSMVRAISGQENVGIAIGTRYPQDTHCNGMLAACYSHHPKAAHASRL